MSEEIRVVLVVEDRLSEAVMVRLLSYSGRGFRVDRCLVMGGCSHIKTRVPAYRNACNVIPHVVLTDLDHAACAPELLEKWGLPGAPQKLLFRVAVREVEAWLLADAIGFAAYSGVPVIKLPSRPEALDDPKQTLVNIVRHSKKRRLVTELIPPKGSRVPIGPLYNERLSEFVRDQWDIERAQSVAPSLKRTIERLRNFIS